MKRNRIMNKLHLATNRIKIYITNSLYKFCISLLVYLSLKLPFSVLMNLFGLRYSLFYLFIVGISAFLSFLIIYNVKIKKGDYSSPSLLSLTIPPILAMSIGLFIIVINSKNNLPIVFLWENYGIDLWELIPIIFSSSLIDIIESISKPCYMETEGSSGGDQGSNRGAGGGKRRRIYTSPTRYPLPVTADPSSDVPMEEAPSKSDDDATPKPEVPANASYIDYTKADGSVDWRSVWEHRHTTLDDNSEADFHFRKQISLYIYQRGLDMQAAKLPLDLHNDPLSILHRATELLLKNKEDIFDAEVRDLDAAYDKNWIDEKERQIQLKAACEFYKNDVMNLKSRENSLIPKINAKETVDISKYESILGVKFVKPIRVKTLEDMEGNLRYITQINETPKLDGPLSRLQIDQIHRAILAGFPPKHTTMSDAEYAHIRSLFSFQIRTTLRQDNHATRPDILQRLISIYN